MIAGLYLRVSTVEQKKHGHSIDAQKTKLLEYCKKNNIAEFKFYIDEGKSGGFISKRPAMIQLIDDLKNDKLNMIITNKLDRFSRNLREFLDTLQLINETKCEFVSLNDNIDTTSPQGRFYLNVMMSMYELERELAKQRTEEIQFELKDKGTLLTRLPFGYEPIRKKVNGKLKVFRWAINQKKAGIVKQIHSWKSTKTIQEISKLLDMPYNTVKDISNNRAYFGYQTYKGEEYKCDAYEAIL